MGEWWSHVRRGPAGPALLASAIVVGIAVRFAPERAPSVPQVYRTTGAVLPDEDVANAAIGTGDTCSAHHLRIRTAVRAHLHRRHDETVVVLAGHGRLRLDADTVDVEPGTVIRIPRGTVHALQVTGPPVEAISVFAPSFDGVDRVWVDE